MPHMSRASIAGVKQMESFFYFSLYPVAQDCSVVGALCVLSRSLDKPSPSCLPNILRPFTRATVVSTSAPPSQMLLLPSPGSSVPCCPSKQITRMPFCHLFYDLEEVIGVFTRAYKLHNPETDSSCPSSFATKE